MDSPEGHRDRCVAKPTQLSTPEDQALFTSRLECDVYILALYDEKIRCPPTRRERQNITFAPKDH